MSVKLPNGKSVEIVSVRGESDDVQIDEARYEDSGEHVSDEDLEWIYDNCQETLYEAWFEKQIEHADHMMDMAKDAMYD